MKVYLWVLTQSGPHEKSETTASISKCCSEETQPSLRWFDRNTRTMTDCFLVVIPQLNYFLEGIQHYHPGPKDSSLKTGQHEQLPVGDLRHLAHLPRQRCSHATALSFTVFPKGCEVCSKL